jgi:hypothetical protein
VLLFIRVRTDLSDLMVPMEPTQWELAAVCRAERVELRAQQLSQLQASQFQPLECSTKVTVVSPLMVKVDLARTLSGTMQVLKKISKRKEATTQRKEVKVSIRTKDRSAMKRAEAAIQKKEVAQKVVIAAEANAVAKDLKATEVAKDLKATGVAKDLKATGVGKDPIVTSVAKDLRVLLVAKDLEATSVAKARRATLVVKDPKVMLAVRDLNHKVIEVEKGPRATGAGKDLRVTLVMKGHTAATKRVRSMKDRSATRRVANTAGKKVATIVGKREKVAATPGKMEVLEKSRIFLSLSSKGDKLKGCISFFLFTEGLLFYASGGREAISWI